MGVARRAGVLGLLVAGVMVLVSGLAGAAGLPDGRAYELVSPPLTGKGGIDVMANPMRVRVATDGNAATFASLGGFGDVMGSGVAFDYMALRTGTAGTSGWVSHPLNPQQPASTYLAALNAGDSFYVRDFTPDLGCGVYASVRPLPGVGNPSDNPNLYVRDDLRQSGAGTLTLLTAPLGVTVDPGFVIPALAGISDDCTHVFFESTLNFLPEASGSGPKLYEWADGTLRLAGILPDGSPAPDSIAGLGSQHYMLGMVSPDGSRVFFQVPSTGNIYVRVDGTTTVQLNTGVPGTSPLLQAVSADERYAFISNGNDLYRVDVQAPDEPPTLITTDNEPRDGSAFRGLLGVSADGSYAYFYSAGQLVLDEQVLRADIGLYAWHEGETRYIGEIDRSTDMLGNTVDTLPGFFPLTSRVSPGGSRLLFPTSVGSGFSGRWGFPGYDHGSTCEDGVSPCRQLYVFDADAGSLACVSCKPSGGPATTEAFIYLGTGGGASSTPVRLTHALSADGRRVFFTTVEALLPEDSNGRADAYEYDVDSASLHLISTGKDPSDSFFMEASPNGNDVFIATRQRLVGWDIDQNYDLYDARVGGGLPDPTPAPPGCAGESCQGQPSTSPAPAPTGSNTYTGPGNTTQRLKPHHTRRTRRTTCTRRNRKKKRCTKAKRARHAAAHMRSSK